MRSFVSRDELCGNPLLIAGLQTMIQNLHQGIRVRQLRVSKIRIFTDMADKNRAGRSNGHQMPERKTRSNPPPFNCGCLVNCLSQTGVMYSSPVIRDVKYLLIRRSFPAGRNSASSQARSFMQNLYHNKYLTTLLRFISIVNIKLLPGKGTGPAPRDGGSLPGGDFPPAADSSLTLHGNNW